MQTWCILHDFWAHNKAISHWKCSVPEKQCSNMDGITNYHKQADKQAGGGTENNGQRMD